MRWQGHKRVVSGDIRTRTVFAFLPMQCPETALWYWLELICVEESYESGWADSGWVRVRINRHK